jgi:hypothetical protein
MKKELTIEHLAAYLPYDIRMASGHYLVGVYTGEFNVTRPLLLSEVKRGHIHWEANLDMDKPLLRPLSQLTEVVEHNGERFVPSKVLYDRWRIWIHSDELFNDITTVLHYDAIKYLHSLHFDTFGLIEANITKPIPSIPQP